MYRVYIIKCIKKTDASHRFFYYKSSLRIQEPVLRRVREYMFICHRKIFSAPGFFGGMPPILPTDYHIRLLIRLTRLCNAYLMLYKAGHNRPEQFPFGILIFYDPWKKPRNPPPFFSGFSSFFFFFFSSSSFFLFSSSCF